MKYRVIWMSFILFGIMSVGCLAQGPKRFADLYRTGREHQEAERYAEARTAYEKALEVEGITPDQTGQTLVRIGEVCLANKEERPGLTAVMKVWTLEGISNATRIQANIVYGQRCIAYPWRLERVRDLFAEALSFPEITPEQRLVARKGLIRALMGLRQFGKARAAMLALAGEADLTPDERVANQISIGITCLLEGKYAETRTELKKALEMEGVSDAQKAEIQLRIGLSYYEAGDYERAKPELEKVLTMRGADVPRLWSDGCGNSNVSPVRAAKLRLFKMNPAAEEEETIAVLFIGGSLTSRYLMPHVIERIAASAPAGRPRIMAGMYTRGGTKIDTFWNDGDTRDTARGMIASMPWDAVVLATFHTTKLDDLLKYGKLFGDFARSRDVAPVFYECQLPKASPYPEAIRNFHKDNIVLRETLNIPVAPVALAMTCYLGETPTPEQVGTLYDDWIHSSPKGVHLVAYCLYSAITGYSPIGLYHDENISEEDARALQEAAWKAVQESNPALKPWTGSSNR